MATVQSAGLTQWSQFDVPGMWSLLRNVSTVEAFRQAGAWQSTYEAAQSLARRLTWYRDGLAGKWSPDRSDAASLYLGRLDELIGSAQQLADVSVSNREALVTLANAVDEARPKLQRVYEESQAIRQVAAQPKAEASVALRQQQLHKQATDIMESLGSAAMDSWRHYATADDYQPPQSTHGGDVPLDEKRPSIVRPPAHEGRADMSVSEDKSAARYSPNSESASAWEQETIDPSSELISLSGSARSTSLPQSLQPRKLPAAPVPDVGALVSGAGPKPIPTFAVGQGGVQSTREGVDELRNPTTVVPTKRQRSGVIGRQSVEISESVTSGNGRTVNGVGGVIGGENAGAGVAGLGVGSVQRGAKTRRRAECSTEDPWHVTQGVLPVLRPSTEPTHFDPGPGVIGLDH